MSRTNTGVLFYLKNPKSLVSPVKCVFCYSNHQLYYYEKKLSIETRFWNKKSQRAKETKSFQGVCRQNKVYFLSESISSA